MAAPDINVGIAAGPPPGPPPSGPPFDDPVKAIKAKFLLGEDIYNLISMAFANVGCALQEHEEQDPTGLRDKPKHYCALAGTGEIVALRVTQRVIEDPTIPPICLHNAVMPFLADAAGLYVFAETQELPDSYKTLIPLWQDFGRRMRWASFILSPQVQQLRAANETALIHEVKRLLRLDQVVGLLDEMSDVDKRYVADVIAKMAGGPSNVESHMESLVNGLELKGSTAYYSALSSYAGEKRPDYAAQKLIDFCQTSTYPKNDPTKHGFTMLGRLLLTILEGRGDVRLVEFIAKYRLVTDGAEVARLQGLYPGVVF